MKTLLSLILLFGFAPSLFASQLTCSNATQTLSYVVSSDTSGGTAFYRWQLKYKELDVAGGIQEVPPIELLNEKKLDSKDENSVAEAKISDSNKNPAVEWVICKRSN
jgi:hypothetical protein